MNSKDDPPGTADKELPDIEVDASAETDKIEKPRIEKQYMWNLQPTVHKR